MVKAVNKMKIIGLVTGCIIAVVGVAIAYMSYNAKSLKQQVMQRTSENLLSDLSSNSTGTATYTQSCGSASKSGQAINASDTDKSGIKVINKGILTLSNLIVTTTGETSSVDNSNLYGLNSGVLAETGSKINLRNCAINTSGSGANAVFAAGSGSTVTLSNVTIKTTADFSHGLDAALTGTVNAKNVNITTAGTKSAALAIDNGQGAVQVTDGNMTTFGVDSPGIYSMGKVTVCDGEITAAGSEAAVVEGKNSISLTNTDISGAKKCGVRLYQAFSEDAEKGSASFKMIGGSLKAEVGPLFYAANTNAVIEVKGVNLSGTSGIILEVSADNWTKKGVGGAAVNFKADSEALNGNIICDNISTISLSLQNNTILKGCINTENKAKSIILTLDKTSIWDVKGNSYITSLSNADSTLANIHDNGNNIYYDAKNKTNSWLGGKTYTLVDGGKLMPVTK